MKNLILLIVFISLNIPASAQIIYHKYDPPVSTTVYEYQGDTAKFFYLDVNNDSVDDVRFWINYWYQFQTPLHDQAFSSGVIAINGSWIGKMNSTYPCNALLLDAQDTISERLSLDTTAGIMYFSPGILTCSPAYLQKYLPVELDLSGNVHYGWILLSISVNEGGYGPEATASLNVYDFAYNSRPGAGLIAGDTLTSIPPQTVVNIPGKELVRISPNPVVQSASIRMLVLFTRAQLADIHGNVLLDIENIADNLSLDFSNLENGIYFLRFIDNTGFSVTKKIIK